MRLSAKLQGPVTCVLCLESYENELVSLHFCTKKAYRSILFLNYSRTIRIYVKNIKNLIRPCQSFARPCKVISSGKLWTKARIVSAFYVNANFPYNMDYVSDLYRRNLNVSQITVS